MGIGNSLNFKLQKNIITQSRGVCPGFFIKKENKKMAANIKWDNTIPTFETDIEKAMHKIVSSIHYWETVKLSTESLTKDEEKAMIKALRKSAKFNCIDLKIQKIRDQESIKISANVI
jgi:hypothetical protein